MPGKESPMAAVSSLQNLRRAIDELDPDSHQLVWLTEGHELAVGAYPNASRIYDFAAEQWKSLNSKLVEAKRRVSLLHFAKRIGNDRYEIETEDAVYELGSATQTLCWGLEHLERKAPGTLDALSKQKGYSKRPVARNLEDLYDLPSQRKFAEQIATGHFVATNNKAGESLGFLRRAASLANASEKQFSVRRRKA
jgi:hypothetical protein